MALTVDEFEELKSLIGGGAPTQQEPKLPPTSAGGGRGLALTGVTNPLEFIAAQKAYEAQKKLEQEKIALEKEGFLGYTGRKAKETLFGLGTDQGTIGQNLAIGLLRRSGMLSKEARQYLDAQETATKRDKQIEQEIAQMQGRETGFIPKVGENIANIGRYAVTEPKLFGSQIVSGMADPAQLLLGGVGLPVRGATLASNIARTAGGGALAGGVTAGARTFGQGNVDAEQIAEEAATGGVLNAGLYGVGRAATLPYKAVTAPFRIAGDILMPAKEPIPRALSDLVAKD